MHLAPRHRRPTVHPQQEELQLPMILPYAHDPLTKRQTKPQRTSFSPLNKNAKPSLPKPETPNPTNAFFSQLSFLQVAAAGGSSMFNPSFARKWVSFLSCGSSISRIRRPRRGRKTASSSSGRVETLAWRSPQAPGLYVQ